jgi:hypothetical protein
MNVLTPRLTRGARPPPGGFCFSRTIVNLGDDVSSRRPRTRVYIDGFNFYYAAFRRAGLGQYKWLDLVAFCRAALPRNDVQLVQYFTAPLDPSRGRGGQRARQAVYLAALRATPGLQTHYGQFVEHAKSQWLVDPPPRGPRKARVWVPEEKGSDVNLASHLLVDGFTGKYEVAVVVSNDADLLEPVRLVRAVLGLPVGVIKVEGGQRACVFAKQADFVRTVRRRHFAAAQLPEELIDVDGRRLAKPREWIAT